MHQTSLSFLTLQIHVQMQKRIGTNLSWVKLNKPWQLCLWHARTDLWFQSVWQAWYLILFIWRLVVVCSPSHSMLWWLLSSHQVIHILTGNVLLFVLHHFSYLEELSPGHFLSCRPKHLSISCPKLKFFWFFIEVEFSFSSLIDQFWFFVVVELLFLHWLFWFFKEVDFLFFHGFSNGNVDDTSNCLDCWFAAGTRGWRYLLLLQML